MGRDPGVDFKRRLVLQAALAAGSLFLPVPYAYVWALSEGALKLIRTPRIALVIGNSKYQAAAVLTNPANDAKAIADTLKQAGFDVTTKLDVSRGEMAAAIQAYAQTLAAKKCVGLFYFAGHGLQLAWRNYLIPVDAAIDTLEDVAKQGIDVGSLIQGITKAANPMNVIILDACRENPFGKAKIDQKGLSQMDAPQGTLLAYATSPGNLASDGEGANGLYTENLLREMKVKEAKIEDVFKRVRLSVRRKSNGAQIPWESTSLEEDFWFLPPTDIKELSDKERDDQFEAELALWEKIRDTKDPGPLEDFLRRYPSGPFSELAQHQLDALLAAQGEKKVQIAPQEGNPFSQGSAGANTKWQVGDTYTYRRLDRLKNEERRINYSVAEITANEVRYRNGLVTDLLGNTLRLASGGVLSPNQLEPLDYVVGKQWVTQFRITTRKGKSGLNEMDLRIVAREKIIVPAGSFNAFRIEGRGVFEIDEGKAQVTNLTKWMAPDQVRRAIAIEQTHEMSGRGGQRGGGRGGSGSKVIQSMRWELISFKQS